MPAEPPSFRALLAIPPSTASTADSVLIIIDAQNEYASGKLAVSSSNIATSRPAIAKLLQRFRSAGAPVAHVVHRTPDGAPVFTPGTALPDEFAELAPAGAAEFVVEKRFPGSFAETDLQARIEASRRRKLVLVGYMSHVCVSTTAREAHQRGYDVLVVEDGIGDRDIPGASAEEVTKMVLLELADTFATIVKSDYIQ